MTLHLSCGPPRRGHLSRLVSLAALATLALAACGSGSTSTPPALGPSGGPASPAAGGSVKDFELTAHIGSIDLGAGHSVQGWTYNQTIPGPVLRVRQGDLVRVTFHNNLPQPSTIHWHGVAVPNGEDGVAGVTQDATPVGATVVYSFIATTAGTYWYHPHQHSAAQEDNGLYGALVVDPATPEQPAPAVDQTLMLDEWAIGPQLSSPPANDTPDMAAYGVDTINGKTGTAITSVQAAPGSLVRLRVINAGFLTHAVHVHGAPVRIVATDGHELAGGQAVTAPLLIAAAERLDLEFTMPSGTWSVDLDDGTSASRDVRVPLTSAGSGVPPTLPGADWHATDAPMALSSYVAAPLAAPMTGAPVSSTVHLGETMTSSSSTISGMAGMPGMDMGGSSASGSATGDGMGMGSMQFTVDGKTFPDTPTVTVNPGDLVTMTFVNDGVTEHPMHVHGHAFTVVSTNGKPWSAGVMKDTVLVPPQGTVIVRFLADNPGVWMVHCHELHHAEAGMDFLIAYHGAPRLTQLGGPTGSTPE